jgi:hypothetical protein
MNPIEDCRERVRVIFNGVPVADSARAKILTEGRLARRTTFPAPTCGWTCCAPPRSARTARFAAMRRTGH